MLMSGKRIADELLFRVVEVHRTYETTATPEAMTEGANLSERTVWCRAFVEQ